MDHKYECGYEYMNTHGMKIRIKIIIHASMILSTSIIYRYIKSIVGSYPDPTPCLLGIILITWTNYTCTMCL